ARLPPRKRRAASGGHRRERRREGGPRHRPSLFRILSYRGLPAPNNSGHAGTAAEGHIPSMAAGILAPSSHPCQALTGTPSNGRMSQHGEVPEWSIGAVSKTVEGASLPRVRISPSPLYTGTRRSLGDNPEGSFFGER